MKITITKTRDFLTPDLRSKMQRAANPEVALRAAGTIVISLGMRAFTDPALRPTPWRPLAASTLRQRQRDGRGSAALMRTGLLSRSPRIGQVTRRNVTVVSDRPYASFQQLGTKRIPARPFMPFMPDGRLTPRARTLVLSAMDRALALRRP